MCRGEVVNEGEIQQQADVPVDNPTLPLPLEDDTSAALEEAAAEPTFRDLPIAWENVTTEENGKQRTGHWIVWNGNRSKREEFFKLTFPNQYNKVKKRVKFLGQAADDVLRLTGGQRTKLMYEILAWKYGLEEVDEQDSLDLIWFCKREEDNKTADDLLSRLYWPNGLSKLVTFGVGMKLDPYFRKYNHNKMTFSTTYAYSENYVLVLSHDEVVHLKCSMINKMPGLGQDKFENLKAGYSYMIGHPGKKLLFMGQDFGQYQEWSEERELDWYLLGEQSHQQLQNYVKQLFALYKKYPALYANDANPQGLEWINADDATRSIYSFMRMSPTGRNNLLFVINYTPVARDDYRVGVPKRKQYKLILNSREPEFGGHEHKEQTIYKAVKKECDGRPYSFAYPLPAYGVAVFLF